MCENSNRWLEINVFHVDFRRFNAAKMSLSIIIVNYFPKVKFGCVICTKPICSDYFLLLLSNKRGKKQFSSTQLYAKTLETF